MSRIGIEALERAKVLLGGQTALARVVGKTQPTVHEMLNQGKKVPAEWCMPIELATNGKITRHELRPDLFADDSEAVRE